MHLFMRFKMRTNGVDNSFESELHAQPVKMNSSEEFELSLMNGINVFNTTVLTVESILSSNSSQDLPEYFKVLLHLLYNLVLIGAVFGNSLVLYVVFSIPRMRTVTNFLLANLALGDLVIATVCVPFTYLSMVFGYWPFGNFLCYFVSPFNAIGVLVSAFTLIALAIEKYVAILHPLAPRLRKSRVGWVIGGIWVAAVSVSTPIAFVSEVRYDARIGNQSFPVCTEHFDSENQELVYNVGLMMIQYFIPLAVLSFTYTRITCVVWGIQHGKRNSWGSTGDINLNRNTRMDNRSRKAVLLTLAVVTGFTMAWFPYNLTFIIQRHYPVFSKLPEFPYIFITCHWLAMSHCCYNPVIYVFINSSFKKAFKDVYVKIYCSFKTEIGKVNSSRASKYLSSFTTTRTSSTTAWKNFYSKRPVTTNTYPKVCIISSENIVSHDPR